MISKGEILGGSYQIIQEIGQGGTGIIYLAYHLRLCKKIVVKKIKDNFAGQVNGRAEVDILKKLHHTCLPQVYDFLVIGGSIYTVMDYIEGHDLQYYLDRQYQFPETLLRQWLLELSDVLSYLHSQKKMIIHSDIKPANIMVTEDNGVCLIDFNISIDGENSKDIQGISPWYAAPEQYVKAQAVLYGKKSEIQLDQRMDIYSLGAVFYRIMTGYLPSPDKKVLDIMEIENPYSDGLKAIISKAMKKNPSARFRTARQMNQMIEDVARMDPVYRRYGRMQAAGIFLWLMLVMAGGLMVYYGNWQNSVESWNQAYRELYISAEMQNDTEIVSQATRMLNDFTYQAYRKRNEDQKAEVLHVLGDSYFRQEQFQEASGYYREAWEIDPDKEGYCRDYIISLIRSGQNSKARQVMESSKNPADLSKAEIYLIQAEIAWAKGNMEEAVSDIEAILENGWGEEEELVKRACLLASQIYVSAGEYDQALEMLEAVRNEKTPKDILRQTGQTAAEAALKEQKQTARNTYLRKAYECYQLLNQSDSPSYEDMLNYALTGRALGDYEGSNTVLKGMLRQYSKDYRIPMWMCYNYLDIVNEQRSDEDIKEELWYRYKDCQHLYREAGQKDPDMDELAEVMEELEG